MDLAKFISMLSKKSLYFACVDEFEDPYEGYPLSMLNRQNLIINYFNNVRQLESVSQLESKLTNLSSTLESIKPLLMNEKNLTKNRVELILPKINFELSLKKISESYEKLEALRGEFNSNYNSLSAICEEWRSQSAISCWHLSEHESEAMWKLYSHSKQGIAIESTIEKLKDSLKDQESIKIDRVVYIPENELNKEYDKHDPIFTKRKSFEHEKELRAKVSLKDKGKGIFVECDLDVLVTRIHVSPLVEPYFKEVVEDICAGNMRNLDKKVNHSMMFEKPRP